MGSRSFIAVVVVLVVLLGGGAAGYAYDGARADVIAPGITAGELEVGGLSAGEARALLGSLETDDLVALRDHERSGRGRPDVLAAIDDALARVEAGEAEST